MGCTMKPIQILLLLYVLNSGATTFSLQPEKNPIDLGVVGLERDSVTVEFVVRNPNPTQSVAIHSVKLTCGCSEGKLGAQLIPPTGSTKLTVSVDLTKLKAGPFKKQAFVLYGGDPPTEQLELTFTGSVAPRPYYLGRPVDFGPVRRETLAPRTVYLDPYSKGARL